MSLVETEFRKQQAPELKTLVQSLVGAVLETTGSLRADRRLAVRGDDGICHFV